MCANAPKYNLIHPFPSPSYSLFSPPPPSPISPSWNLGGTQPWVGLWARYLLSLCQFPSPYDSRTTPLLLVCGEI